MGINLKNHLDLPEEILEKILERQEDQGNTRNLSIFENNYASTKENGGFDWDKTPEGGSFWWDVIVEEDTELFFQVYPKKHSEVD